MSPVARRILLVLAGGITLVGAGGALWWTQRPPPPDPTVATGADRKYEDVSREEYEEWMRSIGYTE